MRDVKRGYKKVKNVTSWCLVLEAMSGRLEDMLVHKKHNLFINVSYAMSCFYNLPESQ